MFRIFQSFIPLFIFVYWMINLQNELRGYAMDW